MALISCTYEVTTNHGYEPCEFCVHFAFGICTVKAFLLNRHSTGTAASYPVGLLMNYLCFADLKRVQLFSYMKRTAMKNFKEGEKSLRDLLGKFRQDTLSFQL